MKVMYYGFHKDSKKYFHGRISIPSSKQAVRLLNPQPLKTHERSAELYQKPTIL